MVRAYDALHVLAVLVIVKGEVGRAAVAARGEVSDGEFVEGLWVKAVGVGGLVGGCADAGVWGEGQVLAFALRNSVDSEDDYAADGSSMDGGEI